MPKLAMGKVSNVDIQPTEHIEYDKPTQTDESHLQLLIEGITLNASLLVGDSSAGLIGC